MKSVWFTLSFLLLSVVIYVQLNPEIITDSNIVAYNSERFHGTDQQNFFEGWYFKATDKHTKKSIAVITGILTGDTASHPNSMAFIMVLYDATTHFYTYPTQLFKAETDRFHVKVASSWFNESGYHLDVRPFNAGGNEDDRTDASKAFVADLRFEDNVPCPKSLLEPSIMGWFGLLPSFFLECNHGLVSIDSTVNGLLTVDGEAFNMNGKGYIEKDWGTSFPDSWIWFQTNDFENVNASIFGSVAMVPWITYRFPGFLFGLWYEGEFYRFTTYSGAKFRQLDITEKEAIIEITDESYTLKIVAQRDHLKGEKLYAPKDGIMQKIVLESIDSDVRVSFYKNNENGTLETIFSDTGSLAGLEIEGNTDTLKIVVESD